MTAPLEPPSQAEVGFDVLLSDGSTAHVRLIRSEDEPSVTAFYARLSDESRRLRFLTPHPLPADDDLVRATHFRGPDDLALVAFRGSDLVAMAQYDRISGRHEAEVAFVVDDAYHGRGLATILLEHLAAEARNHGIRRFVAYVLNENHDMLHVLDRKSVV